jgi:hypothetical protein
MESYVACTELVNQLEENMRYTIGKATCTCNQDTYGSNSCCQTSVRISGHHRLILLWYDRDLNEAG